PAALPATQAVDYKQPVYTAPTVQAAPVVTNSIKPMRVAQATVPTYPAQQAVYTAPQVPVYRAAPVPVYQPVQVPVVVQQPSYVYQQPVVRPDYAPTGAISKEVLNRPVEKITTFYSLPRPGPRPKIGLDRTSTAAISPNRVSAPSTQVPIAPQAMPPMPQQPEKKSFSIAKFFSLPKPGPRGKKVDYTSTASIRPPAAIPNPQRVSVQPNVGNQAKVASVAPVSLNRAQVARTSGRWTSAGGSMITVRPGDDINALSRRYGVPAKAIADVNGLMDQSFIAPGQRVLIPVYQQQGVGSVASVNSGAVQQGFVPPSSMRTPKPNPLRLQSRTPYGQQIIKMQQTANADQRHMVMPGETLTGVARRYNVSVSSLAAANNMQPNAPLRMGQRLHVPGSNGGANNIDYTATASINRQPFGGVTARPSAPIAQAARITRVPMSKPRNLVANSNPVVRKQNTGVLTALPKPKARRKVAALQPRDASGSKTVSDAATTAPQVAPQQVVRPASASNQPKFRWPVRGRIISAYGRKRDGGRNDGINLAVPAGTSVRVAESGTVIYSGSKLKGYGNLVLVQHANGWVTAYAHNNKLLVGKGQQVRRGQIIAEAGKTGEVDSPQLHFELRVKGDPVDPVPYLVSS
ncbi:MAG: peptidoglycan DD-metalloendopeptidase family protein, partial [Alphaproteobacteria bacterium]|nr:peptidoglycan DD-metalloendopeptidase family protein [Alphaproteobacteria bacterium]